MQGKREPDPSVWKEVRRRRVGRLVVAYLAVAFAVVEGTAYFLPAGGTAEGIARVVLGAVVLGFPAAVVLAWTFDLTPGGVIRTPDDPNVTAPEPTRYGWLVLTFGFLVAGFILRALRP